MFAFIMFNGKLLAASCHKTEKPCEFDTSQIMAEKVKLQQQFLVGVEKGTIVWT